MGGPRRAALKCITVCETDSQWEFAYETGSSNPVLRDNLGEWMGWDVGGRFKRGDTPLPVADSCCCMAEPNIIL